MAIGGGVLKAFVSIFYFFDVLYLSTESNIKIGVYVQRGEWRSNISETVQKTSMLVNSEVKVDVREVGKENLLRTGNAVCGLINNGSEVIVSFTNCLAAKFLKSQASFLRFPLISVLSENCKIGISDFSVTFNAHYSCVGNLAKDISLHMEWSTVLLIYDDSMDYLQVQGFLTSVSSGYTSVRLLHQERRRGSISKLVMSMRNTANQRLPSFVHLNKINIFEFLESVKDVGMDDWNNFWVIISNELTKDDIADSYSYGITNIVFMMRNVTGDKHVPFQSDKVKNNGVLKNFTVFDKIFTDAVSLASYVVREAAMENITVALNDGGCTNRSATAFHKTSVIAKNIREVEFEGLTGSISFSEERYLKDVRYSIYSPDKDFDDRVKIVGVWSSSAGLRLIDRCAFTNRFYNFKNKTFLIGSKENLPFVGKVVEDEQVKWIGFCIDILDQLAGTLNFRYKIVEPEDDVWGVQKEDGTWNGVIGDVINGKINFGIGPFTITSPRGKVIDFTKPFLEDGVGIISRKSDKDSEKMVKMFQPFLPSVWGFVAFTVCVVGLSLFVASRLSPYTTCNRSLEGSSEEVKLDSCLWLVFGTLMQQGCGPKPSSGSGRIILGCFWIFTILIASTFTANLVAFLTVSITKKPINSLAELAGQDEIRPLVTYGSNLYSLFKDSRVPVYHKIWQSLSRMPKVHGLDSHLALVRTGEYAFLGDKLTLQYVVLNDCDTYTLADDVFNTGSYGFVLPKNGAFRNVFNHHIMKMQETGLMNNWKKKWWKGSDNCTHQSKTSSAKALDVESLAGPFLIYVSACIIASVSLIIETLIGVRKADKRKPKVSEQCTD